MADFNSRFGLPQARIQVITTLAGANTSPWLASPEEGGLDAFCCMPGIEGSHEKGGVEGEVGRFRRNRLVPVPEVGSLAELNEIIDCGTPRTTPGEPFETGRALTPRVDRLLPGHGADETLLGAGPADRQAGPGAAACLGAGDLRWPC